jgi:CBS domain-containing protein
MLTGHGAEDSAKEALKEGAFDYLAKPCDMDLLSAKITEAFRLGKARGLPEERAEERIVEEVMVPLEAYTTVRSSQTVREAIGELKKSFASELTTSRIMETGHRSVLVFDDAGSVQGILAIRDLLEAIMPAYLNAPRPFTADSIQYSPMFWKGMFTIEVKALAKKKMKDVMSPAPLTVDAASNLMEAAYKMVMNKERRLVVVKEGQVVGVIREQDLFFEMERIQREMSP